MTTNPDWDEHLRIGDKEREQAATALGEHYAQGRLTTEEHSERLDRIWAAKTRSELAPIFRDLPGPGTPRPAGPAPARPTVRPPRCGRAGGAGSRSRWWCSSESWSPSPCSRTCR